MKMPEDWNDLRMWSEEDFEKFAGRYHNEGKLTEADAEKLATELEQMQDLLIGYVCGMLSR